MIKLNRTTEYSLMALRHMSRKAFQDPQSVTSAREIADSYGLPFEITAKTLQRLKDTGLIQSAHGARGGYTLQRALSSISLAEFLDLMEGPQSLVACAGSGADTAVGSCEYNGRCEIRGFMSQVNSQVYGLLRQIRLEDLANTLTKGEL